MADRSIPRLEQLRAEGILELEHGAYRASEIALYSSYQLPLPAARAGTDKHPDDRLTSSRNPTDKRSGCRTSVE